MSEVARAMMVVASTAARGFLMSNCVAVLSSSDALSDSSPDEVLLDSSDPYALAPCAPMTACRLTVGSSRSESDEAEGRFPKERNLVGTGKDDSENSLERRVGRFHSIERMRVLEVGLADSNLSRLSSSSQIPMTISVDLADPVIPTTIADQTYRIRSRDLSQARSEVLLKSESHRVDSDVVERHEGEVRRVDEGERRSLEVARRSAAVKEQTARKQRTWDNSTARRRASPPPSDLDPLCDHRHSLNVRDERERVHLSADLQRKRGEGQIRFRLSRITSVVVSAVAAVCSQDLRRGCPFPAVWREKKGSRGNLVTTRQG